MRSTLFCLGCGAANESVHRQCFACGRLLELEKEQGETLDATLLHDRYLLGGLLGEGGFSRVYRGSDQLSGGRVVAIKEIALQGLSAQEAIEATETFHREMRVLSALTHSQVPRVYDHFSDQRHWYLILEYIEGQTLETFLAMREAQSQPPRLEEILDMALQLCIVLSYLHCHQPPIIYRDLKPSNIMRTHEGSLVLIDFGIARTHRPGQAHDTQRLGSPGYAAPEQYGHAQTTPQSDIYSFGVLLSFLLSGQDPSEEAQFSRSSAPRLLEHEVERAKVAALAQRMRSPDPSRRPQSCQEIASELDAIKQRLVVQESTRVFRPPTSQLQEPQSASAIGQQHIQQPERQGHLVWSQTTPRLSRRTMLIGLGMLTTVVAGTSVGIGIDKWNVAHGTIVADPISTFQGQGHMIAMAWSADGKRLASVFEDTRVQTWDAITGRTVLTYQMEETGSWDLAAWSPDGKAFVITSEYAMEVTIQVWNLVTHRAVFTRQGPFSTGAAWSPDGKRLTFASGETMQMWDAVTGRTILTYQTESTLADYVYAVAWSPDGKHIVTTPSDHTLQVWDTVTGRLILTYQGHTNDVYAMAWSLDSKHIASADSNDTVRVWDAATGRTVLTYQQDYQNNMEKPAYDLVVPGFVQDVAWSPDGKHIASTSGGTIVQVWDVATGRTILTYQGHTNGVYAVAWSPDGKYIACASLDGIVRVWNAP